ncbi:MAG: RecB-like helicase [Campylobacterales bacterium]
MRSGGVMRFEPYLACEASAGSGKTWQLSLRYAALLLMDTPAERILCLTFTNKAAAEMLERISELLDRLGDARHQEQRKILCGWLQISETALLDKLPQTRSGFLRARHRIMTIDAFFNQILRQFALHSGLSPLFEIGPTDQKLLIDAFLKALERQNLLEDLRALCLEQHRTLESLYEEFARLYAQEAEIERFNFAPQPPALLHRLEAEAMAAFEAVGAFIRDCSAASATAQNLVRAQNIREAAAKTWLQRDRLEEYTYFKKCYRPPMDDAFAQFKQALKAWFAASETQALARICRLYACFEQSLSDFKKQARKLDFADVTHLTYKLLTQGVEGDFFYFKLDGRIEHLLIDEFQDTSTVQFEILRPLIEEFTSGMGTPAKASIKSFFYVGDAKQSIYRFRGGNPHLFAAVQRNYANIRRQTLAVNFRSLQMPVDFVNRVFEGKIDGFVPQKAHRSETGFVKTRQAEEPLEAAVQTVTELLSSGIEADKIALLTFTNDDGQAAAEALLQAHPGLSVTTETTQLLINQKAVRAVIEGVKYLYFKENLQLANFNALRGAPLDEAGFEGLEPLLNEPPLTLAAALIERFGLYEPGGGDLLRFLEWVATLSDVESLIFGYESLTQNAAGGERRGVTILTVHKSKGLEFEHTLVLDRLGRRQSSGGKLIFDHEGVFLRGLAWRQKGREAVDERYRELIESQRAEAALDQLNTLYVALTRARDSLYVFYKPSGSDFEPLELTEGEWGRPPVAAQESRPQTPQPQPSAFNARPLGRQSGVLKTAQAAGTDLGAQRFGLALHHALETLGGFDPAGLSLAIEGARNRYGRDTDIGALKGKIAPLLVHEPFLALVAQGAFLKEAPLIAGDEAVRLDLLIDTPSGWIVVDYKSGGASPEHHEQVRRYLALLKQTTGRGGSGYIAYLGHNTRLVKVEMP